MDCGKIVIFSVTYLGPTKNVIMHLRNIFRKITLIACFELHFLQNYIQQLTPGIIDCYSIIPFDNNFIKTFLLNME